MVVTGKHSGQNKAAAKEEYGVTDSRGQSDKTRFAGLILTCYLVGLATKQNQNDKL